MDDDRYVDRLSYGPEDDGSAGRGRRPSWTAAPVAIALVAGLFGWQAGRTGRTQVPRPTVSAAVTEPAAIPTATLSPTPRPVATAFEGDVLRSVVDAELVVGGDQPAIVRLPDGHTTSLSGLPSQRSVGQLLRVRGGTLASVHDETDDSDRLSRVYLVRDGSTVARRIAGRGYDIRPAASGDSFWLMVPGVNDQEAAEERDLSGRLLRKVVLPRGRYLMRGVSGGLLVVAHDASAGPKSVLVWDPDVDRSMRSLRRVRGVVAATGTHVAWTADDDCDGERGGCGIHVTDLRDGTDVFVPLPPHGETPWGDLSPNATELVLVVPNLATSEIAPYRVSVSNGVAQRIDGAVFPSDASLVVAWTDDGRVLLLAASTGQGTTFALVRPAS